MKPLTDEKLKRDVVALTKKLGIAYQTMGRYIKTGKFPAEVCMRIESLSEGNIKASSLRSDLFKPTRAQEILASQCVNHFVEHTQDGKYELIISILNYLEDQQPELYQQTIQDIAELDGGKLFVAQRLAHRQDGQI